MKRTQRNLLIIMTVMVMLYLVLTRLPPMAGVALLAAILVLAVIALILGRDWLIGHRHAKRRRWQPALERYQRFEKKLLRAWWRPLVMMLQLTIYSFDGVAIVRNQIAQIHIESGELEQAVQWLRAALQRDPLYSVPYVNLAIVAAMRRDEAAARREMTRAVQLGFSPVDAQRLLRRALELGTRMYDPERK